MRDWVKKLGVPSGAVRYILRVPQIESIPVPEGSLLAEYGGPEDYRDCFARIVPGDVSLEQFIQRFYRSMAFLPERLILKAIRAPASSNDAIALARGDTDRFGVWKVAQRQENQILLESKSTGTASWLCIEPTEKGTRLIFGSWVGNLEQSGWRVLQTAHVWYSRELLSAV